MKRLFVSFIVTGLILFPASGVVNGGELFPHRAPFFSADPVFQADVMALEKRHKTDFPIDYEANAVSAMSYSAAEAADWNEIRLPGLTLSLSRHGQEKEPFRRRINMTPENNWDAMAPLLSRGVRYREDIELLGGFLSPYLNFKIEF